MKKDKGNTIGQRQILQQLVLEHVDIHIQKKNNLDIDLTSFTRIHSKWVIDLNVKLKTISFLEDNIGEIQDDLGYVWHTTPKAQSMREIIDKSDFTKMKNLSLWETLSREWEDKP